MRGFTRSGYMTACSFTAMLLVIEAASRLIAPTLPVDPGKWPRVEMASKIAQMRDYVNRDEKVDVLFVGSSMMAGGISPVDFTESSGRPSYNAAFAGPSIRTLTPWVLDVVEPLLRPQVVVIGLQTRDLNDNSRKNTIMHKGFLRSPGYKQAKGTIATRLEGGLENLSYFLRYRRALREPSRLFAVDPKGERALAQADLRQVIGASGTRLEEPVTYRPAPLLIDKLARNSLADFSVGGVEYEALLRLERKLEKRDVELMVLNMPVTDDYWDAHEDPLAERGVYGSYLSRFAERHDVTLVDAEGAFPSSVSFRDPIHLDIDGRAALARALGESWSRLASADGATFRVECSGAEAPECRVVRGVLSGEQ